MDKKKLIDSYALLDELHTHLGFTLHQKQWQITVHGRTPLQVHSESWGVNSVGNRESFANNADQVTARVTSPYVSGSIAGDEKRDLTQRLLLLSYDHSLNCTDRGVAYIEKHPDGVSYLKNFVPKSAQSFYPVTEAFQTLVGDFTLPAARDPPLPRGVLNDGGFKFNWDYQKMFRDQSFTLHMHMDEAAFDKWTAGLVELVAHVEKTKPANGPMCYLDLHERKSSLSWYIDCCWPAHASDRTFFTAEEARKVFGKPV